MIKQLIKLGEHFYNMSIGNEQEHDDIYNKVALRDTVEKEIDLVQSCITRMAKNSFEIKKWTVGLIAVQAGILHGKKADYFVLAWMLVITLVFWFLDGFFLKMEKLYRKKYEWIIEYRLNHDDYSCLYDLEPYNEKMFIPSPTWKKLKDKTIVDFMISKTIFPFYMVMIALCIAVYMSIV